MNRQPTSMDDAVNMIADRMNLTMEGAQWVYDNSGCPDWDADGFAEYDFLGDPATLRIPACYV